MTNRYLESIFRQETLSLWLWCGFIAFLGGFYVFPPGKLVNNIFYAGVLIPALFFLYEKRPVYLRNRVIMLAGLLLTYFALSSWWGTNAGVAAFLKSLKYVCYILLYIFSIAYLYQSEEYFWRAIAGVLLIACVGVFINYYVWCYQDSCNGRMFGFVSFQNAVDLGIAYGFLVVLSILAFFKSQYYRKFFVAMGLFFIWALGLTGTRMAVLATFIALATIALMAGRNHRLMISGVVALSAIFFLDSELLDRFLDIRLNQPRFLIWQQALVTADNPWIGLGLFSSFRLPVSELGFNYTTTHSLYVGTFLLGGGIAFAILVLLYLQALKNLWVSSPISLSLLIYAGVASFTHGTKLIGHPEDYWLFWWFPFGLAIGEAIRSATSMSSTNEFCN